VSLEGLDDVPWAELEHAYGRAGDVPGQIRGLLSEWSGAGAPTRVLDSKCQTPGHVVVSDTCVSRVSDANRLRL